MEQELFSIHLSHEGVRWIRRTLTFAKLLFGLALLTSVINIIRIVFDLYNPNMDPEKIPEPLVRQQIYLGHIYFIFWIFLVPIQAYYYYKFLNESVKGIEEQNSHRFNRSFRLLMMNAIILFVFFIVNFGYIDLKLYLDWSLYKKYK
jgi:cytochrome b561